MSLHTSLVQNTFLLLANLEPFHQVDTGQEAGSTNLAQYGMTALSPWSVIENMGSMVWPLGGMLLVAVTLILERSIFWWQTNGPGRSKWLKELADTLKSCHSFEELSSKVRQRKDIYSLYALAMASRLFEPTQKNTDVQSAAAIQELLSMMEPPMRRYMHLLSSMITAAPMLGILGTVIGLINSMGQIQAPQMGQDSNQNADFFRAESSAFSDSLGPGIAQAMTTTAAGLIIALIILFPYSTFRAQIQKTLNQLERLSAAALQNPLCEK